MLKRRDYAIIALGVIGVLLVVAAIVNQLIIKSTDESYAPSAYPIDV